MFDDWDGIKDCEKCGNYTTGRLCRSCAEQQAIDDDDLAGYYPVSVDGEAGDDISSDNDQANFDADAYGNKDITDDLGDAPGEV